MKDKKIGYAFCGSFCTIDRSLNELIKLKSLGADIFPIMSDIVYSNDTRFTKCEELRKTVTEITNRDIIHTIPAAEPIGPKGLLDLLIICPCTGNTLSKLSLGITDTSVTMAAKGHLRNQKPLLLALATNDALSGSAQNIGKLLNTKNVFFVPFGQDDSENKPTSMICDFEKIIPAAECALNYKQLEPIFI